MHIILKKSIYLALIAITTGQHILASDTDMNAANAATQAILNTPAVEWKGTQEFHRSALGAAASSNADRSAWEASFGPWLKALKDLGIETEPQQVKSNIMDIKAKKSSSDKRTQAMQNLIDLKKQIEDRISHGAHKASFGSALGRALFQTKDTEAKEIENEKVN